MDSCQRMKSIKVKEKDWIKILEKIKKEYPPSYYLIRENSREKLGFTQRTNMYDYTYTWLDFYNEHKKTLFLLKYGDLISSIDSENR